MSGGDRYYRRLYSNVPTSTQTTKNENSGIFLLKEVRSKIFFYYYKDLFTHKDINTYINGVV